MVVGSQFTVEDVGNSTLKELEEFEAFVNIDTIDIYNVITLSTDLLYEVKKRFLFTYGTPRTPAHDHLIYDSIETKTKDRSSK